MESYKLASRQKLRIQTNKGLLSVEQLWDLPLSDLDTLAVELEETFKQSGKKSFLTKSSAKDKIVKLKFDVVLDVLNTKAEEAEKAAEAKEVKEHNNKILKLIADKKDDSLKGLSVKQLEAKLR